MEMKLLGLWYKNEIWKVKSTLSYIDLKNIICLTDDIPGLGMCDEGVKIIPTSLKFWK